VELNVLCGAPWPKARLEGSDQSVLGKTALGLRLVGENVDTYGLSRPQHPLKYTFWISNIDITLG
jgi:hypothetical protein